MAVRRVPGRQLGFTAVALAAIASRQILSKWEPDDLKRSSGPDGPVAEPASDVVAGGSQQGSRWLPPEWGGSAVSATPVTVETPGWLPDPAPSVTLSPAPPRAWPRPRIAVVRRSLARPAAALGTAVLAAAVSLFADGLLGSTGHPLQGVATAQAPPAATVAARARHRAAPRTTATRPASARPVAARPAAGTATAPGATTQASTVSSTLSAGPARPGQSQAGPSHSSPSAPAPTRSYSSGAKPPAAGTSTSSGASSGTAGSTNSGSQQPAPSGGGSGSPVQSIVSTVTTTASSAPSTVQTVVTTGQSTLPPPPQVP